MNKNEEIEKLKNALMERIKSENDARYIHLSPNEVMKIVIDSSNKGKYVLWVLGEYIKGNIQRFEDMGRVKQALTLFKNNLSKFTDQQKQLNKMSFQELEMLVSPYQDVLTQNEIKRMNKEKIWSEIDVIYNGPEGKIYSPKTKEASIFLGQGTKWCTAATSGENMFDLYNQKGPLYIFVLPEKDEEGREIKYQLQFESNQIMDMEDRRVDLFKLEKILGKLADNLSLKQKFIHCFGINDVSWISLFGLSTDLQEIIIIETLKVSGVLEKIPRGLITKKVCESAVRQNGCDLKFVPRELRTKELCELAVKSNTKALQYVPQELKTKELCELAAKQNGNALEYIPQELKTKELCEMAVKQNGSALCYVPLKLITEELCEVAVKNNAKALQYVPGKYAIKELQRFAIQQDGNSLFCVPDGLVTPELCELAVQQNGNALEHVPFEFKTKELCWLAVKNNGIALEHVPDKLRTQELCEIAVRQNGDALYYIPAKSRTKELCELAVRQNGNSLYYVPWEVVTFKLCESAVQQDGLSLRYVQKELMTKELCELAVRQNGEALKYVRDAAWKETFLKNYVAKTLAEKNMSYVFEEVVKMTFHTENNEIKNLFGGIKDVLKPYYTEIKSEELAETFSSNTLSFS